MWRISLKDLLPFLTECVLTSGSVLAACRRDVWGGVTDRPTHWSNWRQLEYHVQQQRSGALAQHLVNQDLLFLFFLFLHWRRIFNCSQPPVLKPRVLLSFWKLFGTKTENWGALFQTLFHSLCAASCLLCETFFIFPFNFLKIGPLKNSAFFCPFSKI